MLVTPQHFQINDVFQHYQLYPSHKYIIPYFEGIRQLKLELVNPDTVTLNVERGEFLFKDMTHVVISENALINSRSFKDAWKLTSKPIKIYIGLKRWKENSENVTIIPDKSDLSAIRTRFITTTESKTFNDLHEGSGATANNIRFMYYALRLFAESEIVKHGDYEFIPIAQLVKKGKSILISRNFIPPTINIKVPDKLFEIIKDIQKQIFTRIRELEPYKRNRSSFSGRPESMRYILALGVLNKYFLMIEHLLYTSEVHPWTIFGLFMQMIGELSTYSDQINLTGENPTEIHYDHNNIKSCFSKASGIISKLLYGITAGAKFEAQLEFDGNYFSCDLPQGIFEGKNRFYLAITSLEKQEIIVHKILEKAILGTSKSVALDYVSFSQGIGLQLIENPSQELPPDIPFQSHSIYFIIDHNDERWGDIKQNYQISLLVKNIEIKNTSIQLLVSEGENYAPD